MKRNSIIYNNGGRVNSTPLRWNEFEQRIMKIVYVDMDSVLVNFQSGIDALTEEERVAFKDDLDDVPGIFSKMKPVDGAIEAYEKLTKHFDVYILSTAPWNNPSAWTDKLLWVQKHLGDLAHKRLILSHNKNLNAGDFLIDDRTANNIKCEKC